MKKSKLFVSFLAVILFIAAGITANAQTKPNILANYPDGKIPPSVFVDAVGDSCSGAGLEQHDGSIHADGFTQFTDSVRFVIKMHPPSYPWVYTNVCCAFTQNGGVPTHLYDIIVYDTLGAGGSPGNILQVIPGQNVTGIPNFPAYTWNSTTVSIPVSSTLGAIYIGYRYKNSAGAAFYCTVDEASPLWPGYGATNLTFPATWATIQSMDPNFINYKCMAIRTQGHVLNTLNQPNKFCSNYPAMTGSGAIFGHAVTTYGDTVYVAGGDPAGAGTTNFYKYSIGGNTWSTGTSLPTAKSGGDLVACGGKIYYIGGGTTLTAGDNLQYAYNPANGTWLAITNIPTAVTGNVAVQVGDANIYCLMGGWATYSTAIQVYNVAGNSWSTATAFSGGPGRRSFAAGIMGRTIFVACGYNGTYLNSFVKGVVDPANPLTITWTAQPNAFWTASRAGGTAIAGKFYLCPGDTGTGIGTSRIGIYDTTTATWSYVGGDPFPASNYWGAMASSLTICNGVNGVKVWRVGGLLSTETTRPLIVFSDTCLTGCGIVGVINHNVEMPDKYTLFQNYPNPFNPTTDIKFAIPKAGFVKMVIYDVLGREVKTLVNEYRQAGVYNINFDASSYSSGVYFYRIEAGNFIQTKKMLLIK
jgi:hypothetical protein